MEKFINYIFESIIKDVNNFEIIYNNYDYLTWIFLWIFWAMWIWLKYLMLTCPVWIPFNMMFSKTWKFQMTHIKKPWIDKKQKQ